MLSFSGSPNSPTIFIIERLVGKVSRISFYKLSQEYYYIREGENSVRDNVVFLCGIDDPVR